MVFNKKMNEPFRHTEILSKKIVYRSRPFNVEECNISISGELEKHSFHRLSLPSWVNILAITKDSQAVLIRQDRIGAERNILEVPGGEIDPSETDVPQKAAARELEEETGYASDNIVSLGSINPNPASHKNRVHFFLALDAYLPTQRQHFPDTNKRIEVLLIPLDELKDLVKNDEIDHALSALLVYKALGYLLG